jgi:hypothetical protein
MYGDLAGSGQPAAADAAACASRSFEVQQLAVRMGSCAEQAGAVLAALGRLELHGWESPAGRAYRTTLGLQAAALRRARAELQDAATVVLRHAQHVTLSSGRPGY